MSSVNPDVGQPANSVDPARLPGQDRPNRLVARVGGFAVKADAQPDAFAQERAGQSPRSPRWASIGAWMTDWTAWILTRPAVIAGLPAPGPTRSGPGADASSR